MIFIIFINHLFKIYILNICIEVPKVPRHPDEIELHHSNWNGFHESLTNSSEMFDNSKIPHNVLK